MLPSISYDWPAEGTSFWINGTYSDLWPKYLDEHHGGGVKCLDTTTSTMSIGELNMTGCIWSGFNQIAKFSKSAHLNDEVGNITINDGLIARQHLFVGSHVNNMTASLGDYPETWALPRH